MGRVIVFTGAGISAESGIPTYRDKQGLWEEYDTSVLCDFMTWEDNAEKVHEFYNKRRMELAERINGKRKVQPNVAHHAVDRWLKEYNGVLITQNVDDLHEQAGSSAIHLHGRLNDLKCVECFRVWEHGPMEYNDTGCVFCGSKRVKPGVIFFHEYAPNYTQLTDVINNITEDDIIVVIGTQGNVVPIDIFLSDKPGYKILNNLTPNRLEDGTYHAMNGIDIWDEIIYEPCSEAVSRIDYRLKDIMQ